MKILNIDDEYIALTKMEQLFTEYGECETAKDGISALQKIHEAYVNGRPFDMITIDIEMPRMNGLQLLTKIREEEEILFMPNSIKIMITADGSPQNVMQAAKNKCDAYLVKPVKKDALKRKLIDLGIIKKQTD